MRILMSELADGESNVLAGAPHGRKVFGRMMERTSQEPATPEPAFLDFSGVEVATASFLRETVLAYRNAVRRRRSNFYPVVANASALVSDELAVLVASDNDVLMMCLLSEDAQPLELRLIGELDPKQRITFDLVRERGETDAAELMREHGDSEASSVKQTAWNNRLSSLVSRGLLVELSQGRAKRYRLLFQEN
jgi:hypothetical protein